MAKELNHLKIITPSTQTISNAGSTQLLAANSRRLYAEIVNSSDVGVWLNFGAAAVIGTGIYLGPNGWSYEINSENMWRGTVTAIAAAGAGKVVGIIEGQ